ncbi:Mo25-like protein [Polychytrium aggregatum]|uniref:Mo25-like protein n=1 Tax=Polychytrium aggregatum TaxID=110093 RepID=UPI0022FDFA12|nr:Mo25-like protein [Polychytrium aggregatum]KAI9206989.1 Mo25-like protein [Polychytrium aggregatum]
MSFLFRNRTRTPSELVRSTKEAIAKMNAGDRGKWNEEISRGLLNMKIVLYGDGESEPIAEQVTQLAQELHNNDMLTLLIQNIAKFEFEAKKDVAQIFNNLLRRQISTRLPTVDHIAAKPVILRTLVSGYENHEIALNCGIILRECLRHETLAEKVLLSEQFWLFFTYVEFPTFDVSSDAFASFKDLLTKHKTLFFSSYTLLLNSNNYVTKRQSLKLLGELLLDRSNFQIMTRYISDGDNLKLMMNFLRDRSRNIQFEAFHVFKVFVANPRKPKAILDILERNKDKLVTFLSNFHNDRTGRAVRGSGKAIAAMSMQPQSRRLTS